MTIKDLKEKGIVQYMDLKPFIKNVISQQNIIILIDGSHWHYNAEDDVYELNPETKYSIL